MMGTITAFPIPTVAIPGLPDVGPISDASKFVLERAGTGSVLATAVRDYVTAYTTSRLPYINVLDVSYGAKGDGVTDDSAAFQAAYDAAPANGLILVPATGNTYTLTTPITGTKSVTWECYATPTGGLVFSLPGVVVTRVLSSVGLGGENILQNTCSDTDFGTLRIDRNVSFTGGHIGNVNAAMRATTTVSTAVASFEWSVLGIMNNSATGGQNVAVYGQGNRQVAGTGPTWAAVFEAHDHSGENSPGPGLVGIEVDVYANGPDAHASRIGIDISAGIGTGTLNPPTIHAAIRVAPANEDPFNAQWVNGLLLDNFAGTNGIAMHGVPLDFGILMTGTIAVGMDTSGAVMATDAIRIGGGQAIAFDGNSTVTLSETAGPLLSCSGARLICNSGWGVPSAGNTSATATTGAATLPANPAGFVDITIDGTTKKLAYYNA